MSTDSSWGDYLSSDTSLADAGADVFAVPTFEPTMSVAEPVLPTAVADAVDSAVTQAAADQDWSDWHAASGDQWAESAQDWVDYAHENIAAGDFAAAESALNHAATHADIAESNYDVAVDYSVQADAHLGTAAAEIAPYDTYTYDAGTSFDIAE